LFGVAGGDGVVELICDGCERGCVERFRRVCGCLAGKGVVLVA
jgi:hypothetical protein